MVLSLLINRSFLSHRHVEATLLYLVLDIATIPFAHIAEHLAEYPFQCIVAYHAARWTVGVLNRLIAIVADIEGSTIEMARLLGGIAVTTAKLHYILLRTKHAGDNELMERDMLDIQTVEELPTDVVEQYCGPRHKIRDAPFQRVDMVIRTCTDIDQLRLALLRFLPVAYYRNAILLGIGKLYVVGVGERLAVAEHANNGMLRSWLVYAWIVVPIQWCPCRITSCKRVGGSGSG